MYTTIKRTSLEKALRSMAERASFKCGCCGYKAVDLEDYLEHTGYNRLRGH